MYTITIAPLSAPGFITEASRGAIRGAKRLFVQTVEHKSAHWLLEEGLSFQAMDDLYARAEDFDALNLSVAKRLLCGEDCVYAPLGRGMGKPLFALLSLLAEKENVRLVRLPAVGFAEAAQSALPQDEANFDAPYIYAANALFALDPYHALAIEDVDTPIRAGEVKLALSEYFPDDHPVYFCVPNQKGEYEAQKLPLYELDRQSGYFADAVALVPPARFEGLTRHGAEGLMHVLERLRTPSGCPWDAEQTHASLRRSVLEEAYEVADAIDKQDDDALCEELGDLFLQIGFHAHIASERAAFTLRDVTTGIVQKLVYRHPHVFGDTKVSSSGEVLKNWETLKTAEKGFSAAYEAMEAVPAALPALTRAQKIQKKAASVGFDWNNAMDALHKIYEEADELKAASTNGENSARLNEELGDLLFSAVNVARLMGLDAEEALKDAAKKFTERFKRMEKAILSDGKQPDAMTLEEMDIYWDAVKERNC